MSKRVIHVEMHGGCIEGVYTNIPGMEDVEVIFTEARKYLDEDNEVFLKSDPDTGIYTVHVFGSETVDLTEHITASEAYGDRPCSK
jgi:hypothetical protein